jgi:hypothetical protein
MKHTIRSLRKLVLTLGDWPCLVQQKLEEKTATFLDIKDSIVGYHELC